MHDSRNFLEAAAWRVRCWFAPAMNRGLVTLAAASFMLVAVACSSPYADGGPSSSAGAATGKETTGATDATEPPPTAPISASASGGGGPGGSGPRGADGGAGQTDAAPDASAADPAHCPSKSISTVTPWKAPPAASAACSAADITYFGQVAATQTWLGIESLMTTRNAACSACIFSHDTDASWHAVIYSGTQGDAIVNYAACFATATGGSVECGHAVYEWSDCYARACDTTACGTDDAVTACYNSQGASDACVAYSPITACGGADQYAAINNVCASYIDTARTLCAAEK